jgi:hypothetical protein
LIIFVDVRNLFTYNVLMTTVCKVLVDFINNYQKAVEDNKAQEEAEKKKKDKEEKEKAEKERQEKSKADRPASPGAISMHSFAAYHSEYWKRHVSSKHLLQRGPRVSSSFDLPVLLLYRAVVLIPRPSGCKVDFLQLLISKFGLLSCRLSFVHLFFFVSVPAIVYINAFKPCRRLLSSSAANRNPAPCL